MWLGPKFSAKSFQKVMQQSLGGNMGDIKNIVEHAGGKTALQSGVSTKNARLILNRLEASGQVEDMRGAQIALRKAEHIATRMALRAQERTAAAVDRLAQGDTSIERFKTFGQMREEKKTSAVQDLQHTVSALDPENTEGHGVSFLQSMRKVNGFAGQKKTVKPDTKTGGGSSKSRLIDIPLY